MHSACITLLLRHQAARLTPLIIRWRRSASSVRANHITEETDANQILGIAFLGKPQGPHGVDQGDGARRRTVWRTRRRHKPLASPVQPEESESSTSSKSRKRSLWHPQSLCQGDKNMHLAAQVHRARLPDVGRSGREDRARVRLPGSPEVASEPTSPIFSDSICFPPRILLATSPKPTSGDFSFLPSCPSRLVF